MADQVASDSGALHRLSSDHTVFITGATGLLGNHVTRMLTARGVRVRALVRDLERGRKLLGDTGAELVTGDMRDVPHFADALAGVDVLLHTAAYFRDSYKGGDHARVLIRINVEGTRELIAAAYARGVRRVVHTSSMAVLNRRPGASAIDETMPRALADAPDDYYRSKLMSDAVVDTALREHPDLFACFVLPGFINGPGDAGPTSAGQMVLDFMQGKVPGAPALALSYVDARDVAEAVIAAAERGRRGERYLVAGRAHTMRDALTVLARVTQRRPPSFTVPNGVVAALALGSEMWHRISGKPVLTSWQGYRTARRESANMDFDSTKAMRELGISFRPLEDTFADTVAWYRRHGWLGA